MADKFTNPFESEAISPLHADHWNAVRRVSQSIRALTEVLVTSAPPIEDLHNIAAELEKTAKEFKQSQRIYGHMAFFENHGHGSFGEVNHELNPLAGKSNPLAPPLKTWTENNRAYGKTTMGWAYEGPPHCVHGGFVAAIFDQFMGQAQSLGNAPGMTGTLSTRYISPTPLNAELKLEGWIEKVEGRKTTIVATMHSGETLTASCEGLFIEPRHGMGMQRDKLAGKKQ